MYLFPIIYDSKKNRKTHNKNKITRASHIVIRNHYLIDYILSLNGFSSMSDAIYSNELLSSSGCRRFRMKGIAEASLKFGISKCRASQLWNKAWSKELRKIRRYEKDGTYSAIPFGFEEFNHFGD